MKAKFNFLRKPLTIAIALFFVTSAVFAADDDKELFLTGYSNATAGNFVVQATDDVYHYQGVEYTIFNVFYDNPDSNMKIALLNKDNCKTFIAFTDSYWFRYNCSKDGFGVRKAMFNSVEEAKTFNSFEFNEQSVLVKQRKLEKNEAVSLIATNLPKMKG